MKLLHKVLARSSENKEPEDVLRTARIVGPAIDNAVQEIFFSFKTQLIGEPITYIIPAVWGATKNAELTATQKEINRQVVPVIQQVLEALELKDLTQPQAFAIGFVVRGTIISKIIYMVELTKNQTLSRLDLGDQETDVLEHLEPMGNA